MDKQQIINQARNMAHIHLNENDIEAIVIWGSIAEKEELRNGFDVDILVVKKRILFEKVDNESIFFGLPTKVIIESGVKYDVFYVDKQYITNALEQGHWTVFSAIKNGIIIYDSGVIENIRHTLKTFKSFTITKPKEWKNQAFNLLDKSKSLIESKDYISGIILARHAADAMVQSYLFYKLGKPSSPKSFLEEFKQNAPNEYVYNLYLRIHGLSDVGNITSIQINLMTFEFLDTINLK